MNLKTLALTVLVWTCFSTSTFAQNELPPDPPEPTPKTEDRDEEVQKEPEFDPRIPRFHLMRPTSAFQVTSSLKAFGGKDLDPRQSAQKYQARAFSFSAQFQPSFFQSYGVLSIGPVFALYPVSGSAQLTKHLWSIWSMGGQMQYQLRFFREQWIVPYAGYSVEYLGYSFKDGPEGRTLMRGVLFGGYLNLNILEPSAAASFYANHKVLRSYLVGELRTQEASDSNLTTSGQSIFFGLRIELQ